MPRLSAGAVSLRTRSTRAPASAIPVAGASMPKLDPARYPRAATYVGRLTEGVSSFPSCWMNRHVLEHVGEDFPDLGKDASLPPALADFFAERVAGEWIPEAAGNAIYLMIRDRCFHDDVAFRAWNQKNIDRLIRNPIFRAIMVLLSPSLVVMGAGKRWGSFHQGTEMTTEPMGQAGGRMQVRATLTYPPGLYDELLLQLHCSTFLAALVATHATDPDVRLGAVTPGKAEYLASWQR